MSASSALRGRLSRRLAAFAGAVLVGALVGGGALWALYDRDDRQAEVAARGGEVMSFDLERTTHVFETLRNGGVQTVVSDDPRD